jgi:pyruvate dehydrogenase E1 component alpha subunit
MLLPQLGGFAFIGEGIPIGLGAAFQIKYRKEVLGEENADQVAVNFFGDGTCNVGEPPHSSCGPTGF